MALTRLNHQFFNPPEFLQSRNDLSEQSAKDRKVSGFAYQVPILSPNPDAQNVWWEISCLHLPPKTAQNVGK